MIKHRYKPGMDIELTLLISDWDLEKNIYIEQKKICILTIKSMTETDDDIFLTFENNQYGMETSISINAEEIDQIKIIDSNKGGSYVSCTN